MGSAPRNITAAVLAMAGMAIISLVDNFVIEMSRSHGLWQFHVLRAAVAVPVLIAAAWLTGQSLRVRRPLRLTARCLSIATGLVIYFSALGALPVAQAGAGLFSAPIWVLILSAILFRYPITAGQALSVFTGFAGVLMLLQPDPRNLSALSFLPLGAGVFYGLGALLTRYWCAEESAMVLAIGVFVALGLVAMVPLIGFSFWPVSDSPGFLTRGWTPLTPHFTWLALVQTVGAIITMPMIAQAYRIGTPAYVAVFEYSFLIFAGLWGLLIWGQDMALTGWVGIALIIAAGMAMSALQRGRG